jgi:hypothetical protein
MYVKRECIEITNLEVNHGKKKKWAGGSTQGSNVPNNIKVEYCAIENLGRKTQFVIFSGALIPPIFLL